MDINERITLLRQINFISEKNYEALKSIVNIVENSFNIKLSNENGEMFITHLSAVFNRAEKEEKINELDKDFLKEIYSNKYYKKSLFILEIIKKNINYKISELEEGFIIVHLCTILTIQK